MTGALALFVLGGGRARCRETGAGVLIGVLGRGVLVVGPAVGLTMGLTVWGAKAVAGLGVIISPMEFWSWDGPKQASAGSILHSDIHRSRISA